MEEVAYRGFQIQPAPHQLLETGQWTTDVSIAKDHGSGYVSRDFSARNTFALRQEAITACVDFGRKIIDGEISGLTVADL